MVDEIKAASYTYGGWHIGPDAYYGFVLSDRDDYTVDTLSLSRDRLHALMVLIQHTLDTFPEDEDEESDDV